MSQIHNTAPPRNNGFREGIALKLWRIFRDYPTFLQEEDDDGSSYYGSPQPRTNQEDMLTPGQVYLPVVSGMDPQEIRIPLCSSWSLDPDSRFLVAKVAWHSTQNIVFWRAEFYLFFSRKLEVFPGAWKAFIEVVDKCLAGTDPEGQFITDPTWKFCGH